MAGMSPIAHRHRNRFIHRSPASCLSVGNCNAGTRSHFNVLMHLEK